MATLSQIAVRLRPGPTFLVICKILILYEYKARIKTLRELGFGTEQLLQKFKTKKFLDFVNFVAVQYIQSPYCRLIYTNLGLGHILHFFHVTNTSRPNHIVAEDVFVFLNVILF